MLIRLRLIGQMEAWTATGESVLPSGRKTRALLAVLARTSPRPMLRSKLAELLWSRRPEEQARASLRQEIHRLSEALAPLGGQLLAVHRDHLAIRPGMMWLDVEEVLRAVPERPDALALLDAKLLEDLDGVDPALDAWLAGERERLLDRARELGEWLLREQTGPAAIIASAQRLLAIDRAHEGAWRALMRAHAAGGERGLALQAYERCRAVLADQLGAHPSEETERLAAVIRMAPPVLREPGPAPLAPPRPAPRAAARTLGRAEAPHEPRPHAPRGGPRVGVLPFQLIGADAAESQLATGLADEITGALARFRWMSLVSSSALARFARQTRDEAAIRRAFAIEFLLDGNIQRVPDRLRVTLRLLDLRAGNQVVWARRFDRRAGDLLALQDEVASEVAAQVDPEILMIEALRISARPPAEPTAADLTLRAIPLMSRLERDQFLHAGELLRQAVEMEPEFAAAHAWAALWHIFLFAQGWVEDAEATRAEAGRLVNRAITLDPQDARALAIAGHVRAGLHRRVREALSLHERALSLNPNLVAGWALSAVSFAYAGDLAEAERRLHRYKKLSPLDPLAFFYDVGLILVALLQRNHEEAARVGRAVSGMNPAFGLAYKPYLAALGHLGAVEEAALVRQRLAGIEPGFSVAGFLSASACEREADRAHYAAGLRLAGVPEQPEIS